MFSLDTFVKYSDPMLPIDDILEVRVREGRNKSFTFSVDFQIQNGVFSKTFNYSPTSGWEYYNASVKTLRTFNKDCPFCHTDCAISSDFITGVCSKLLTIDDKLIFDEIFKHEKFQTFLGSEKNTHRIRMALRGIIS